LGWLVGRLQAADLARLVRVPVADAERVEPEAEPAQLLRCLRVAAERDHGRVGVVRHLLAGREPNAGRVVGVAPLVDRLRPVGGARRRVPVGPGVVEHPRERNELVEA
jgi:hypothetical protein